MNRFTTAFTVSLLCAAPIWAQSHHEGSLDYRWKRGSSSFAGVFDLEASHRGLKSGWVSVRHTRYGQVRSAATIIFNKRWRRLAEFKARGEVTFDARSSARRTGCAYIAAKLLGTTVYSKELARRSTPGSLPVLTKTFKFELDELSKTYMVGPIPVSVSVNLRSKVDLGLSIDIDPRASKVSVGGTAEATIGSLGVKAGVGVQEKAAGASAGFFGRFDLGNIRARAAFAMEPRAHGLKLEASLRAIAIRLGIYAEGYVVFLGKKIKARWNHELYRYTSKAISRSYWF